MFNKIALIFLLLFDVFYISKGETRQLQNVIDSLEKVFQTVKEDTNRVTILNEISWQFVVLGNYDSARKYAGDALSIVENRLPLTIDQRKRSVLKNGKANAYNNFASINAEQGNYPEALKYYSAAFKIYEETKNKSGIANNHNNIGAVYYYQGNYSEAIQNYLASLKIFQEINDKDGIANSYNNIGLVLSNLGNYPEALKNYFIALKINESIENKPGIAAGYLDIGIVFYQQKNFTEALKYCLISLRMEEKLAIKQGIATANNIIGNVHSDQGNYSEALQNYFAALKINTEIGSKQGIAEIYLNLGCSYYELAGQIAEPNGKLHKIEQYKNALKYILECKKISEEIGSKQMIAKCLNNLGQINIKFKNFEKANKYLHESLILSKELGIKDNIKETYETWAELDSTQGNYMQALEHYKLYVIYKDSMLNEENTKKIVATQMQYEFDKKEAATKAEQDKKDALAAEEIRKQKIVRNGFVVGFAVVLLFAGVFFTQRNRISKGKKLSDELLLNILPAETAEELKQTGTAKAKSYDAVTVMFTDFKNFTQASEYMSPEELVTEINYCFSEFDKIIQKQGIEKIKTIGDSYMCAGGLPVENKTNPVDTLNAAIEIQKFMKQHKQIKEKENKPAFEIRIGVHTGPVVAGIVGIKKFAYDIWGDTVNIASRMESSGEAGKVNISGATYELVKEKFSCTHRGKIEAKNKGMIDMYFVENI